MIKTKQKFGEEVKFDDAVRIADKTWNLDRTPIMTPYNQKEVKK